MVTVGTPDSDRDGRDNALTGAPAAVAAVVPSNDGEYDDGSDSTKTGKNDLSAAAVAGRDDDIVVVVAAVDSDSDKAGRDNVTTGAAADVPADALDSEDEYVVVDSDSDKAGKSNAAAAAVTAVGRDDCCGGVVVAATATAVEFDSDEAGEIDVIVAATDPGRAESGSVDGAIKKGFSDNDGI